MERDITQKITWLDNIEERVKNTNKKITQGQEEICTYTKLNIYIFTKGLCYL